MKNSLEYMCMSLQFWALDALKDENWMVRFGIFTLIFWVMKFVHNSDI